MIRVHRNPPRPPAGDLKRVIEPLASYICAADQPRAVLNLVFSALFHEVAQVSREARAHVATFGRTPAKRVPPRSKPLSAARGVR
jgi:hypothetical protein